MIKLEINVSEVDYDKLVEQFLPMLIDNLRQSNNPAAALLSGGIPLPLAKMIVKKMPEQTKEQLVAELLNTNKAEMIRLLEETAAANGYHFRVSDINAHVTQS
jgi:Rod binding domain-containing protein